MTDTATKPKKAMHRNVGEIIKRGSIFYIRYYDGRGRRRLETTKSSKREDAEKQLRKRLSAKDAGVLPEAAIASLTLTAAADDVIADYKTNGKKSLDKVERNFRLHVFPHFGERRRMVSITTAHIRAYIVTRQEAGAKPAQINRELAALRRAFRLALQAGRLVQIPLVPMLQERNTRTGFLEPEQMAAICAALSAPLAAVVKFAYATGWRTVAEVLPLEWRNVDWKAREVRLDAHTTKNGEARTFPFTTEIETILTGQVVEHERLKKAGTVCPFIFHRDGKSIREFRTAWERACTEAGCPGKLIHDMRRSTVRRLERAGVPRSTAMQMVGHKTESIYRRYAIVDPAMLREAAARLDAWAAAPPATPSSASVTPIRRSDGIRGRITG
jgi:integrase